MEAVADPEPAEPAATELRRPPKDFRSASRRPYRKVVGVRLVKTVLAVGLSPIVRNDATLADWHTWSCAHDDVDLDDGEGERAQPRGGAKVGGPTDALTGSDRVHGDA